MRGSGLGRLGPHRSPSVAPMPALVVHRGSENPAVRDEHGSRSAVLSTCLSGAHRPFGSDALHATAPSPTHGQEPTRSGWSQNNLSEPG